MLAWKYFLDTLPKEKANKCTFVLHTEIVSEHGTDLEAVRKVLFKNYSVWKHAMKDYTCLRPPVYPLNQICTGNPKPPHYFFMNLSLRTVQYINNKKSAREFSPSSLHYLLGGVKVCWHFHA